MYPCNFYDAKCWDPIGRLGVIKHPCDLYDSTFEAHWIVLLIVYPYNVYKSYNPTCEDNKSQLGLIANPHSVY